MGYRKVYVNVKARLIIELEEGVSVQEVMDEMTYDFISLTAGASMIDMEILDYEVKE